MNPDVPRDNYFCVVHPVPGPDGKLIRPYCTPNTDEAAKRFRMFKEFVNKAAVVMGLKHQVDATNSNLDEPTYHLMIHVAQRLDNLRKREGEEVPELVAKLAISDPQDFLIVATDVPQLEVLMSEIGQGVYGRWIPLPPPMREKMPRGKLAAIAGAGLLFSAALLFVPKEWTLYGIRPHEVRPSE
jgi:hypothetical protein